jgi:hypothetical protein
MRIIEGTTYDPDVDYWNSSVNEFHEATGNLPYGTGTLLKKNGAATVHIVDYYHKLRCFSTMQQFTGMGFSAANIINVTPDVLDLYGTEGIDPADGTGNGMWGTFITDTDPLVLTDPLSTAVAVSPAPVSKFAKYFFWGVIIIGALMLLFKKGNKKDS